MDSFQSIRTDNYSVSETSPSQKGIKLFTISLREILRQIEFYPGYITGDAIENLFSQLKSFGQSHPSALHVRRLLTTLVMCNSERAVKTSPYAMDMSKFALNFSTVTAAENQDSDIYIQLTESQLSTPMETERMRSAWMLASQLQSKHLRKPHLRQCKDCFDYFNDPEVVAPDFDDFNSDSYLIPKASIFMLVEHCETVFTASIGNLKFEAKNVHQIICNSITAPENFKDCPVQFPPSVIDHMLPKLVSDFVEMRLRLYVKAASTGPAKLRLDSLSAFRATV